MSDKKTRIVRVRCSYTLPVEVPAEWSRHDIEFHIEENSCPATGRVGTALYRRQDAQDKKDYCWACGLDAENKIVYIPQQKA